MNIHEALKSIDSKKAEYFKYLYPDLRYDQSKPIKNENDFLRLVERRTINSFLKWQKSQEYKNLLMLYLDTKVADDFEEIYKIVVDKAKQGDDKSVRLFVQLQKDIQQNAKLAAKTFGVIEDDVENDEDLDIN